MRSMHVTHAPLQKSAVLPAKDGTLQVQQVPRPVHISNIMHAQGEVGREIPRRVKFQMFKSTSAGGNFSLVKVLPPGSASNLSSFLFSATEMQGCQQHDVCLHRLTLACRSHRTAAQSHGQNARGTTVFLTVPWINICGRL
jgi:ribosomal protein L24